MKRGIEAIRKTGRSVVTYSVDEFRTTMCCCACGAVTKPPKVLHRTRNKTTGEVEIHEGPSHRLRCCTQCKSSKAETAPLRQQRRNKTTGKMEIRDGPPRCLRRRTQCSSDGKLRDRDVQGARNILWLTQALYFGAPRPEYLRRG